MGGVTSGSPCSRRSEASPLGSGRKLGRGGKAKKLTEAHPMKPVLGTSNQHLPVCLGSQQPSLPLALLPPQSSPL
jgi:hypothetical protein